MAGQYKTRCPHCGAQFKISDEHLGQARGAVRCGSCLQIFQATDHFVGETPARPHADDNDTPPPPAITPGNGSTPSTTTRTPTARTTAKKAAASVIAS